MSNLLKTKQDVWQYLYDLELQIAWKAQEAEDLQNDEGAILLRGISSSISNIRQRELPLKKKFEVGDKVKIPYISDCNPHNNQICVITWLNDYCYYPAKDMSIVLIKTQGTVTYEDGSTETVGDFYRKGSGVVSKIIQVE